MTELDRRNVRQAVAQARVADIAEARNRMLFAVLSAAAILIAAAVVVSRAITG